MIRKKLIQLNPTPHRQNKNGFVSALKYISIHLKYLKTWLKLEDAADMVLVIVKRQTKKCSRRHFNFLLLSFEGNKA